MTALFRVQNVSRRLDALKVIDHLSFDPKMGESLGISGPNEAGKSTLFDLITADNRPSAGTVHFDGREITDIPAHARCRLGIGRFYRMPHPFGGMTVFENLPLDGIAKGEPAAVMADPSVQEVYMGIGGE